MCMEHFGAGSPKLSLCWFLMSYWSHSIGTFLLCNYPQLQSPLAVSNKYAEKLTKITLKLPEPMGFKTILSDRCVSHLDLGSVPCRNFDKSGPTMVSSQSDELISG